MKFDDYMILHNERNSMILNEHSVVYTLSTTEKWVALFSSNLPKLEGSEKQVAWAEKLREQKIKSCVAAFINACAAMNFQRFVEKGTNVKLNDDTFRIGYHSIGKIAKNTSSKYWIDNRETSFINLPEVEKFKKIFYSYR